MRNQSHRFFPHSCFLRASSGIFSIFFLLFVSCRTQKPTQYLQGQIDTAALSSITLPELIIQKSDVLSIVVYSDNPELTSFYNQIGANSSGTSTVSQTTASSAPGYLVDNDGNIQFQSLGRIFVEGLTTKQFQDTLNQRLTPFLKNPYCTIRILNKRFTILGEVAKQGLYTFPSERINIFEALGLAGDITIYGIKDSILIVRETNGRRTFGNLNVNDPTVMLSPYYYLQQNDLIIVKATPKKPTVSDQTNTRNLTIVATIATILTSFAVIFNIFR